MFKIKSSSIGLLVPLFLQSTPGNLVSLAAVFSVTILKTAARETTVNSNPL